MSLAPKLNLNMPLLIKSLKIALDTQEVIAPIIIQHLLMKFRRRERETPVPKTLTILQFRHPWEGIKRINT